MDDQTLFFCHLAINFKGEVEVSNIPAVLNRIRHFAQESAVAETLKDHPLIKVDNEYIKFRYSFLKMEFFTTGIYNHLKGVASLKLDDAIIDILGLKANYNSIISKGILLKLENEQKENIPQVIKWFRNVLKAINERNYNIDIKNAACSNLFIIIYDFVKNKQSQFDSKELLINLFGNEKKNEIANLNLINIPSSAEVHLDFTDLIIEKSVIDNYVGFISCKFNEDTYFVETCTIRNVSSESIQNLDDLSISENNFHEIVADNSLTKVFRLVERGSVGITAEIGRYFQLYFKGNSIKKMKKTDLQAKVFGDIYLKCIHNICKGQGYIILHENSFQLNGKLKAKIQKFVLQNKIFNEVKVIARSIPDELRK